MMPSTLGRHHEDEDDTRRLICEVLKTAGARVTAAASAAQAWAAFQESRPDVLVTDIGMPDEDGYALIEWVRGARGEARKAGSARGEHSPHPGPYGWKPNSFSSATATAPAGEGLQVHGVAKVDNGDKFDGEDWQAVTF